MAEHADSHRLRDELLKATGLGPHATDEDAWVGVESDRVDGETNSSSADHAVQKLAQAGIEARQRPFVRPDGWSKPYAVLLGPGPDPQSRIRMEILVQHRDLTRAQQVLAAAEPPPISDEELTRQALESAPPDPE